MRARDAASLAAREFDALVVGGGVYGLAIAADAASRGLSVALVEANDFGSGTSFNHQKTAHGGLRSLQSGRIDRARESIRERRALARIAPRLLRPLPFIVGTYRSVVRNRLALRAAFRLDRWLGRARNEHLEPELHLPPPRLVSRAATLKLFPGVRQHGLTGGAMWYDYQIVEGDRLNIAFAEAADAHGAVIANYVEATGALRDGGRITGMRVHDRLTGDVLDVRARLTINAAGASVGRVMRMFGVERDVLLLRAMNLVTSRPASDIALAAPDRDGRMLTLVPWHGHALIGTSQSRTFCGPDETAITSADVDAFIGDANAAFPSLHLTRDDVTLVHRGVVPARRGKGGRPDLLAAPQILDHAAGAMSVIGVKYTTARGIAARVVSHAAQRLGKRVPGSRTDRAMLPGAGIADHEALAIETARAVGLELAPPIIRHLTSLYGDRCAPIIRLMAEHTDWRMPLVPGQLHVGAEVIHAIRHEMACTLGDVAIRRTTLGAAGHPGRPMLVAMAQIGGDELGWSETRRNDEIAAVDAFYQI